MGGGGRLDGEVLEGEVVAEEISTGEGAQRER